MANLDIAYRLERHAALHERMHGSVLTIDVFRTAATTIRTLRAALRPLADIAERIDGVPPQPHYPDDMDVATVLASAHRVTLGQARVARRVLEGEG